VVGRISQIHSQVIVCLFLYLFFIYLLDMYNALKVKKKFKSKLECMTILVHVIDHEVLRSIKTKTEITDKVN